MKNDKKPTRPEPKVPKNQPLKIQAKFEDAVKALVNFKPQKRQKRA